MLLCGSEGALLPSVFPRGTTFYTELLQNEIWDNSIFPVVLCYKQWLSLLIFQPLKWLDLYRARLRSWEIGNLVTAWYVGETEEGDAGCFPKLSTQ